MPYGILGSTGLTWCTLFCLADILPSINLYHFRVYILKQLLFKFGLWFCVAGKRGKQRTQMISFDGMICSKLFLIYSLGAFWLFRFSLNHLKYKLNNMNINDNGSGWVFLKKISQYLLHEIRNEKILFYLIISWLMFLYIFSNKFQ